MIRSLVINALRAAVPGCSTSAPFLGLIGNQCLACCYARLQHKQQLIERIVLVAGHLKRHKRLTDAVEAAISRHIENGIV
jgi:hypothetical protein